MQLLFIEPGPLVHQGTPHMLSPPSEPAARSDAEILGELVDLQPRLYRKGAALFRSGESLVYLHIIRQGRVKLVDLSPDGHEQIIGLRGPGDWVGLGSIGPRFHPCEGIAIEDCQAWVVRYETLAKVGMAVPAVLQILHVAMCREMEHNRASRAAMCLLPADARVADFIRCSITRHDMLDSRAARFTIGLTRAEMANHLGMRLEGVSRALRRLARCGLIRFPQFGGREVEVPDVDALAEFIRRFTGPVAEPESPKPEASLEIGNLYAR